MTYFFCGKRIASSRRRAFFWFTSLLFFLLGSFWHLFWRLSFGIEIHLILFPIEILSECVVCHLTCLNIAFKWVVQVSWWFGLKLAVRVRNFCCVISSMFGRNPPKLWARNEAAWNASVFLSAALFCELLFYLIASAPEVRILNEPSLFCLVQFNRARVPLLILIFRRSETGWLFLLF